MIIKVLENEYKFITLWVTDIEQAIYPPEFMCTEEQLFEAAIMGHASWSIIQHTALGWVESWQEINDMYTNVLSYLQNSKSKKSQTFYKNIVAWNLITIWKRYGWILACETPLYMRCECGKYLVFIKSWGYDMLGKHEDWRTIIYDNKLYSSYFKDMAWLFMGTKYSNSDKLQEITSKPYDWKVYTVDEVKNSDLGKKLQRWMYPLMHWIEDYIYFQYNVIVKNEAKDKNLMPNVQEIRIKITKEEAETLFKNTIVDVFKNHYDHDKNCLI